MYAKTARESDIGRPVTLQSIWDEIRSYLEDYTFQLRIGLVQMPANRIFTVNYNERPIARFEYK